MDTADYLHLMKQQEEVREILKIMVAGVMADGFTEEQARAIVAGLISRAMDGEPNA